MDTDKGSSTWELQESYNPNDFYMGSTNKRGDSSTLYVKVSAGLAASIAALVQGKTFPYRTNADFVRDAIVHRLQWCADKGGVDLPSMRAEMALSRINQQTESMQMRTNAYKDLERGIRLAKDEDDWPQVKLLTDMAKSIAQDLEEPHSTRFEKLATHTLESFPAAWSALVDE